MKTIFLKLFIAILALLISSGAMALDVVISDHTAGNLATEVATQLGGDNTVLDITSLTISGGNIDAMDVTTTKSCKNLVTLDVSGVAFDNNTLTASLCNDLSFLQTVTLPNTLTVIGKNAFQKCSKLQTINLNENITNIDDYAFAACPELLLTALPTNLTRVGQYGFSNCAKITISELPANTDLGARAFEICSQLAITEIPTKMTTIKERVFDRTGIRNFTIHPGVTSIGALAFYITGNPERTFTCRREALPTLGDRSFGDASAISNTHFYILKKATNVPANVTIHYLISNIAVTIEGDTHGTISAAGTGLEEPISNVTEDIEAYEAEDVTFTVTPEEGYVALVSVDEGDAVILQDNTYTLENVSKDGHTLSVEFIPNKWTWEPTSTTTWDDAANWELGIAPLALSNVVIPAAAPYYPELTESTTVNSITFEPGAEIGGQDNLIITNGAVVQFDLAPDRWHLLSAPVNSLSGDFYFPEGPGSWLRIFAPINENSAWEYITGLNEPLAIGTGFAFQHDGGNSHAFEIKGAALAGSLIEEELSFFNEDESYFALVGNPFMSTIDFDVLSGANNDKIKDTYQIWTVSDDGTQGYSGYNPSGPFGMAIDEDLNKYIAPLQSFIVEKGTSYSEDDKLTFNAATTGLLATGQAVAGLRSSENPVNKIEIIAANEAASVLTFIANRENGQSSRKLKIGLNNLPDIYTLDGTTALGANIIHTDNTLIPVGLSTAYEGDITLTFKGMDGYDAKVVFIDGDEEIDITDRESYIHTLNNYQPKRNAGNEIVAEEERFFLQLSPANLTGLDKNSLAPEVKVYSKDRAIKVVSTSNNLIRQVEIYNAQGMLIYAGKDINAASFTTGFLTNSSRVCIVKITTGQGVKNVKVMNN